jgi:predicted dehydrogenase
MLTPQQGSHNWAAAFAAVPETTVVAVFDKGADTRAQFVTAWSERWPGLREFDDYDRMLAETRPDLVCIATRQTMHADQIERAVRAGARGILSDKPLATSLAETERIVKACRDPRTPLAFGLDRRWTARYRWARDFLASGAIGRLTAVTAYGLINVINHGCHWYDAALMLAGDPEVAWVSGRVDDVSAEPLDSNKRLDPTGRALVGLSNGVTLHVTPDGRPGPAFEVLGETGRLLLLNDARDVYVWTSDADTPNRLKPGSVAAPEVSAPWEAGPALVSDLVNAIRTQGSTGCDVDEARRATEIGFAIHASSSLGGRTVSIGEVDRGLRIESFKWGNE